MKDRIRKLRKALDLTQKSFAERIGMKSNTIATYEMGRAVPSDPTVNNICKEFNVNESWLRYGVGEMFAPSPNSELDVLASKYHLSHGAYILIEKFLLLNSESQQSVVDYVLEVAAALSDSDVDAHAPALPGGVLASEALYEESLDSVLNTESSASNTTEGTVSEEKAANK